MVKTTQPTRVGVNPRPSVLQMGMDVGIWAALQPEVVATEPPAFMTDKQQEEWERGYSQAYQSTVQEQIHINAAYLQELLDRGKTYPETCHDSWISACDYYRHQISAWQERLHRPPFVGEGIIEGDDEADLAGCVQVWDGESWTWVQPE